MLPGPASARPGSLVDGPGSVTEHRRLAVSGPHPNGQNCMRATDLGIPTAVVLASLTAGCTEQPAALPLATEPGLQLVTEPLTTVADGVSRLILTGPWSAAGPEVKVFDGGAASLLTSFFAYAASFTGGVRVATGDINGDGLADFVTGAGPGAGPHVKVFSGATGAELRSFFAFDPGFAGGVFVAAGDVDGDGQADIVTGAGAGATPHVKVFSGATGGELRSFFAFDAGFAGGVSVGAGDVNGDGHADLITGAGAGGVPHVKVFDGVTGAVLWSFFAYDAGFSGGVYVGAGDVDGDGKADIVTGAGAGATPHVKVFSGTSGAELASFFAYASAFSGGVSVAASDLDEDGKADIVTGPGPGLGPHVKVFSGATGVELASFLAYGAEFTGGVFVAGGDRGSLPADQLLAAAEQLAANGDLVGVGGGASAPGRLEAWLDMLEEAAALLESGDLAGACGQLRQAWLRADGASRPADFVTGPARGNLVDLILGLMEQLGCDGG